MNQRITPEFVAAEHNLKLSEVKSNLKLALKAVVPLEKTVKVVENGRVHPLHVVRSGVGMLVTRNKRLYQFELHVNDRWRRYSVIFAGKVDGNFMPLFKNKKSLLIRIDSGCETSQITGDVTCECRDQLERAMRMIENREEGLIIRIPSQEGKGKGLSNKLAAHLLENELHISNVEAAMLLSGGSEIDVRTYTGAISVLKFLGVSNRTKIRSMTNNPRKLKEFAENGYTVERVPLRIAPNRFTSMHLKAKQKYLGHLLGGELSH